MPEKINNSVRPLLLSRCRRLLKLVEVGAPPIIITEATWNVFRTVWVLLPGEMSKRFAGWVGDRTLNYQGLCHYCIETSFNRPFEPQFGMCVECWAEAMADDAKDLENNFNDNDDEEDDDDAEVQ